MKLIRQCDVYAPEHLGKRDVLLGGGKILALENRILPPPSFKVEIVSAEKLIAVPGFIDGHVHAAGAGGEGGPATRTPELQIGQMLQGGITTVIGCLGTDGMTRDLKGLLMKVKSLRKQGVSAWMFTGSYQIPTPTLFGDVGKDIALIDEIIGVGEVAVADFRSSGPTVDELTKLAHHARVGGLLGGKAGIVNLHMGDGRSPFRLINEVVKNSEVEYKQFLPTHCNRNPRLLKEAISFGKQGYVDVTAFPATHDGALSAAHAIAELHNGGVPLEHITMTSDGCGSLPRFSADGSLIELAVAEPRSLFDEWRQLLKRYDWELSAALQPVTANVAAILQLKRKGKLGVGMDGDILLLNRDFEIEHLFARGDWMVKNGQVTASF